MMREIVSSLYAFMLQIDERIKAFDRKITAIFKASFFFKAEAGIRDDLVIGVQTCALPISRPGFRASCRRSSTSESSLAEGQVFVDDHDGARLLSEVDDLRHEARKPGRETQPRLPGQ